MGKFIYVFDNSARDKLLAEGYVLLNTDAKQQIYVFENNPDLKFDLDKSDFLCSDILTF